MALFAIDKGAAKKIPPNSMSPERSIQSLFERNLEEILDITFLASEYSTSFGGRIDTIGIDYNGAPVIIEYKKKQDDNVINQGLSYLRWLLDHKADFGVLLQQRKVLREIDWTSPRVICVAESYNKFDLDTAELLPIHIELLRYQVYERDILLVEPETQQKLRNSMRMLRPDKRLNRTRSLSGTKQYSVEGHLKRASKETRRIFRILKERVAALDETIIEEPKKKYIAYKLSTNFVDVVVSKNFLKLFLNLPSGKLNDPNGLARDMTKPRVIGHWGNGDYEVKLGRISDIDGAFGLIRQSYQYHK